MPQLPKDLIGNVSEWIADSYYDDLPAMDCALAADPTGSDCPTPTDSGRRVPKEGHSGTTRRCCRTWTGVKMTRHGAIPLSVSAARGICCSRT